MADPSLAAVNDAAGEIMDISGYFIVTAAQGGGIGPVKDGTLTTVFSKGTKKIFQQFSGCCGF